MAAGKQRRHRRQDALGRRDDRPAARPCGRSRPRRPRPSRRQPGRRNGCRRASASRRCAGWRHAPTWPGSSPAPAGPARARRAARRWRGRPPGRSPSCAIRSAVAGATTISAGLARQADVADILLVRAVEELGEDVPAGERADRQRRHEFLRRLRSSRRARAWPRSLQAADQVERLVGGDAAADDEQDGGGRARRGPRSPCRRCSQMRRAQRQAPRQRRAQRAGWRASPLPWRRCARPPPAADAGACPRRARGWSGSGRFLPCSQSSMTACSNAVNDPASSGACDRASLEGSARSPRSPPRRRRSAPCRPPPCRSARRASGETWDSVPAFGSASSSPTMRQTCRRPSSRSMVTVDPKRTTDVSAGGGMTSAVARRARQ